MYQPRTASSRPSAPRIADGDRVADRDDGQARDLGRGSDGGRRGCGGRHGGFTGRVGRRGGARTRRLRERHDRESDAADHDSDHGRDRQPSRRGRRPAMGRRSPDERRSSTPSGRSGVGWASPRAAYAASRRSSSHGSFVIGRAPGRRAFAGGPGERCAAGTSRSRPGCRGSRRVRPRAGHRGGAARGSPAARAGARGVRHRGDRHRPARRPVSASPATWTAGISRTRRRPRARSVIRAAFTATRWNHASKRSTSRSRGSWRHAATNVSWAASRASASSPRIA